MEKKLTLFPNSHRANNSPVNWSPSGFTLVELLVVIAVLAVLMALIMPVVQSSREGAKGVACASRLRQIGVGASLYTAENNGLLPPAWESGTPWCWPNGWATTYVINEPKWVDVNVNSDEWQTRAKQFYMCPSVKKFPDNRPYDSYSYGMNVRFGMSMWGFPERRATELTSPSKTIMIVEVGGAPGDGARFYLTGSDWSSEDYRHSNGVNVLFADGHVAKHGKLLPPANTSDIIWDF